MPRGASAALFLPQLQGLRHEPGPLHRQLYERLRQAILTGVLPARSRLPSTRALAADLGVSRNTVELAFSQLDAEGLLERRVGSGSVVALPEHARPPHGSPRAPTRRPAPAPPLRARARRVAELTLPDQPTGILPLTPCMPALDAFPLSLWRRSLQRQGRQLGTRLLTYGEEAGWRPLREAVAAYVGASRGVRCGWQQVLIVSSTQQALDLVSRLLLEEGDAVWMEEPGYLGARAAFSSVGARLVPVPVDEEGLRVDAGLTRAPKARLAYVTPSYQYPLGLTMSFARRLALLEWARASGAWVVEDDYDSEFRYTSRPLAAMQGLDDSGRVLYVGTFNKVMFPSLRLAYLVVPEPLVEPFRRAKSLADGHTPLLSQAAMADFMERGHFTAHLRQMRLLYAERREALLDALRRHAGDRFQHVGSVEAGMHVAVKLAGRGDDVALVERAAGRGLDTRPLSAHYLGRKRASGLVLGFSGVGPAALRAAAASLVSVL
ncbi:PLP-dependent aminotransferase family protein [Vitiosangium sp. GDMCC 1.1324]|uniref:MocR-like pyridoxine biosynthesis transcription factor PdxR n=1 Tax=Vitiosangium sp. (strain GDMCC 1.1324) TaxID=2138576 RepID=UPI000D3671F5|nr:PLP-dependent aminotransferase family protein [Vitiosangium sp. GDMCC 1.1324]PTL84607.1 PLP-dependent aminotransferase family protein [Vitiosangium sp. GDMCC 1.1324]